MLQLGVASAVLFAIAVTPVLGLVRSIGAWAYLIDVIALVAGGCGLASLAAVRSLETAEDKHSWDYWQGTFGVFVFLFELGEMIVFVTLMALPTIGAISAVTYDLAMNHRVYNPFGHEFTFLDSLLYFVDQALRGAFFDIIEVFKIEIQPLHVNAREHWLFGALLVAYRASMSIIVVGLVLIAVQQYYKFQQARLQGKPAASE